MEHEQFRSMIERAKSGEQDAADFLFVACFEALRASVARLMDRVLLRARLEPEDIVQETYVAAWPKLAESDFENFGAFVAWLKTIARNKVIDIRRGLLAEKKGANRQISRAGGKTSSYVDLLNRVASPKSTPSSGVARHEALARMAGQMWRLPEDHRSVIQWRFIQGLPVAEVAQRMKRSEPAIHMLCHRALKKLQQLMGSPSKYLSMS